MDSGLFPLNSLCYIYRNFEYPRVPSKVLENMHLSHVCSWQHGGHCVLYSVNRDKSLANKAVYFGAPMKVLDILIGHLFLSFDLIISHESMA